LRAPRHGLSAFLIENGPVWWSSSLRYCNVTITMHDAHASNANEGQGESLGERLPEPVHQRVKGLLSASSEVF
jgi:hypothetical protein